MKACIYGCKMV